MMVVKKAIQAILICSLLAACEKYDSPENTPPKKPKTLILKRPSIPNKPMAKEEPQQIKQPEPQEKRFSEQLLASL